VEAVDGFRWPTSAQLKLPVRAKLDVVLLGGECPDRDDCCRSTRKSIVIRSSWIRILGDEKRPFRGHELRQLD